MYCLLSRTLTGSTGEGMTQAPAAPGYANLADCTWQITPPVVMDQEGGHPRYPVAIDLTFSVFQLELEDYVLVYDTATITPATVPILKLMGAAAQCAKDTDCSNHGTCIFASQYAIAGTCSCAPGYLNTDCSISNVYSLPASSITVVFSSDFNNAYVLPGVVFSYAARYLPAPPDTAINPILTTLLLALLSMCLIITMIHIGDTWYNGSSAVVKSRAGMAPWITKLMCKQRG